MVRAAQGELRVMYVYVGKVLYFEFVIFSTILPMVFQISRGRKSTIMLFLENPTWNCKKNFPQGAGYAFELVWKFLPKKKTVSLRKTLFCTQICS